MTYASGEVPVVVSWMPQIVAGLFSLAAAVIGAGVVIWATGRNLRHQMKLERERWARDDAWRRAEQKTSAYSAYLRAAAEAQMELAFASRNDPESKSRLERAAHQLSAASAGMAAIASKRIFMSVNDISLAFAAAVKAIGTEGDEERTAYIDARTRLLEAMRDDLGTDLPGLERAVDEATD